MSIAQPPVSSRAAGDEVAGMSGRCLRRARATTVRAPWWFWNWLHLQIPILRAKFGEPYLLPGALGGDVIGGGDGNGTGDQA